MLTLPLHEMVETIVLSHLHHGTMAGKFGTIERHDSGSFTVRAEGRTFYVHTHRVGWSVTVGGIEGLDRDLIEAARLALEV